MSWQISAMGTREGVIDAIKAAKATPENSDQTQIDRVKPLLISEVESLPDEFNGCRLDANGDAQKQGRSLQYSLIPMRFAVRKPAK